MRLINADALKEKLCADTTKMIVHSINSCIDMNKMIDEAPTIDAEPVRHGTWSENAIPFCNECPICGAIVERYCVKENGSLNYCPNCGAKMDGGKQDAAD